jgi:Tfp pilus assembly protein PilO
MDRNRLWVLGAVLLIAATAALGWVLGISPKLDEMRAAESARATVETQNVDYAAQVATLKKQFASIGDLKGDLAALQLAVPSAADIPAFVTQLDAISQQHQVTFTDIAVNDAQPYVPVVVAAVPAAVAPAAVPAAGSTPAPTVAAPVVPTAAEAAAALAPTPSPLITAANFVSVPISLTVDGSYGHVLDFLEALQKGTRLVMVTTFSTTGAVVQSPASAPGANSKFVATDAADLVTAKITGLVYVLVPPATATATSKVPAAVAAP